MKIDPIASSSAKPVRPLSPTGRRVMWIALTPFIGVALLATTLLVLSVLHIARPYTVPTNAMSPTIDQGDWIYTSEISYRIGTPQRGDVVCFWTTGIGQLKELNHGVDTTFIKRVVGLPGETIALHDGQVWIGGQAAPELARFRYETAPNGTILIEDGDSFVVPAKSYFVLGDNTHTSMDSRYWGCVPAANLRGRVLVRFWPPGRMGLIN